MFVVACMCSVVSDYLRPHGLWTVVHQASLSVEFPGQNTGAGCHFLLQGSFLIQGSNLPLMCQLFWQVDSTSSTTGKPFAGTCQVPHDFSTIFCIHVICNLIHFKIMKRCFAERQRHFTHILCMLSRSIVLDSFLVPRTLAHQAPLSMEFSGQEGGAGCHFLP